MPAQGRRLRKIEARLGAGFVEQAQLHLRRYLRKDREVGADPIEGRAEGIRCSGPDLHKSAASYQLPAPSPIPSLKLEAGSWKQRAQRAIHFSCRGAKLGSGAAMNQTRAVI